VKNLFLLSDSKGNLFINLILVLTIIGLIAIIVFQAFDLKKYIGH